MNGGTGGGTAPRIRNKEVRRVRVADLVDHEHNYRRHPPEQQMALAAVVEEIGWYGYPDVYERADGSLRLIDGHLRKSSLLAAYGADAEIEVNVTDMTDDEANKALLTHDPLAAMADIERSRLAELLEETDFDSATLRRLTEDLLLNAPDEDYAELQQALAPADSVSIDAMELRPEEHYDFVMVMADNVNDWNRLVSLLQLPDVHAQRSSKRLGIGRAVRARTLLRMIDANRLHDSDTDAGPTGEHVADAGDVSDGDSDGERHARRPVPRHRFRKATADSSAAAVD